MRSRFVLSTDHILSPKRRSFGSRIVAASVFFVAGAVAANELYPQIVTNRQSDYTRALQQGRAAPPLSASSAAASAAVGKTDAAYPLRRAAPPPAMRSDTGPAEAITEPVPPPSLVSPPQPVAIAAADEAVPAPPPPAEDASAAVRVEKAHKTRAKSAHNKGNTQRANGYAQDGPYRQQTSPYSGGSGWNSWGGFPNSFDNGGRSSRRMQVARRGPFDVWP